jgi:hypothetical protein
MGKDRCTYHTAVQAKSAQVLANIVVNWIKMGQ